LFHRAADGNLVNMALPAGDVFRFETPRHLLKANSMGEVTADSERFLFPDSMAKGVPGPFTILTNWLARVTNPPPEHYLLFIQRRAPYPKVPAAHPISRSSRAVIMFTKLGFHTILLGAVVTFLSPALVSASEHGGGGRGGGHGSSGGSYSGRGGGSYGGQSYRGGGQSYSGHGGQSYSSRGGGSYGGQSYRGGGQSYRGGGQNFSGGQSYSRGREYEGGGRGYYRGNDHDYRGYRGGRGYYGGGYGSYSAPYYYGYGPSYYYSDPGYNACDPAGYYDQWGRWIPYPGCYVPGY
jgi:hypothetical protein